MDSFVRQHTTRPAFGDCTAQVFINGLALLCFSRKFKRAEVGFLNVKDHPLIFTIYDKDCRPIPTTDEFPNPIELHSGTTIKINPEAPQPPIPANPLEIPWEGALYCPTDGDNPVADDAFDFRHLINIDKLHSHPNFRPNLRLNAQPNAYFAKLYLRKGVFFTAELSGKEANIYDGGDKIDDRRVGKIIGARIINDSVKIEISSLDQPKILTKDVGHPYKIDIRYKCERRPSIQTDFKEFYRVLDEPLPPNQRKTFMIFEGVEQPSADACPQQLLERWENNAEFRESEEDNPGMLRLIENFRRAAEACEAATKPKCPENLQGTSEPCPPLG